MQLKNSEVLAIPPINAWLLLADDASEHRHLVPTKALVAGTVAGIQLVGALSLGRFP